MSNTAGEQTVLLEGEFRQGEKFGSDTVNRGAALMDCEWDGGSFEAGVMVGGIFRSGIFRGGTIYGTVWLGGEWIDGRWESGFDHTGCYRPRTDHP